MSNVKLSQIAVASSPPKVTDYVVGTTSSNTIDNLITFGKVSAACGVVNVMDFGAKADDTTDDLPAFNAALAYLKSQQIGGGSSLAGAVAKLYIPQGTYFLSGPLNVHLPVHIYGPGPLENNPSAVIRFAANKWGIVFHEYRTLDNGGGNASTDAGLGDSTGSILEGITLYGGACQSIVNGPYTNPAANSRAAHGVWIRTDFVRVKNVACLFWTGCGFIIQATSGSTGQTAGDANICRFENCRAQFNSNDGFSISGSDSNACTIISCSSIDNGGSGFREYSFLGNTYVGCHADGNGTGDPLLSGALNGICIFSGQTYYIPGAGNASSQLTLASTTQPGTNSAVWNAWSINNTNSIPTWTTGLNWVAPSAPYITNPGNVNAKNVFIGCYAELGQPPVQSTYPTLFVGGALTDLGFDTSGSPGGVIGVTGSPSGAIGNPFGFSSQNNFPGGVINPGAGGSSSILNYATTGDISLPGRTVISGVDNSTSTNWQWLYDGTSKLSFTHGHGTSSEYWGLGNDSKPHSHAFLYLLLGNVTNVFSTQRLGSVDQGSDANGTTVAQGDIFLYTGRGTGKAGMGQICTGAGVVGTSATMVEFGQPVVTSTFSNLPSSPRVGQIASISDASTQVWGANAGGGSPGTYALVNWNGSNWTVIGK